MRNNIILIMKTIKKQQVIRLRETDIDNKELVYKDPCTELNYLVVDLYPILDNTIIPKEALDNSKWEIPKGYYAIKSF